MAREGYFILDSDLHLMEPYDLWERYLEGIIAPGGAQRQGPLTERLRRTPRPLSPASARIGIDRGTCRSPNRTSLPEKSKHDTLPHGTTGHALEHIQRTAGRTLK